MIEAKGIMALENDMKETWVWNWHSDSFLFHLDSSLVLSNQVKLKWNWIRDTISRWNLSSLDRDSIISEMLTGSKPRCLSTVDSARQSNYCRTKHIQMNSGIWHFNSAIQQTCCLIKSNWIDFRWLSIYWKMNFFIVGTLLAPFPGRFRTQNHMSLDTLY